MSINAERINQTLIQNEQYLQEVNKLILQGSHFFIFPFEIQGCVNITENGLKPENLYINDYTYFAKVVSGDHPVVATWAKSTRWIGKPQRFPFMQCEMGARKKYNADWARKIRGMLTREAFRLNISKNSIWGAPMTQLQGEAEIALITTEKEGDTSKLPVLQNTLNLANKVTTSLKFKKQVLLLVMTMLFFPLVD